ncbi:hypothetical protein GWI33_006468 [Rhynchophorus ferrugineus]|uniref:Odorant receptor n=1 Tax=Rhynchophorus ferrugineus TaxID=354439 RepID=A0A834IEX9_RHYFE|nr:hypothetical protein GWI33_006468 [Rhynchophorus ferrugineus]
MIKYGIMDNEYLNISEDKILMDIIHKRTFQLRIKQKLISIHQRYIQLTRAFNLMMDEIKLQIIGVLFQSLAVMYPVYILLYDTSSNTLSFVSSVISVYILAIILSLVVYDIGELYKTKCNEIYDSLTNTTWYNWNNSNRTLYLIIQASLQQPALIRIGINHELDRSHLLKKHDTKNLYNNQQKGGIQRKLIEKRKNPDNIKNKFLSTLGLRIEITSDPVTTDTRKRNRQNCLKRV